MSKAKFCLVCDGKHTYMKLGGKSIGKGIEAVSFDHVAGESARVNLKLNMEEFDFMPGGYFDEASEKMREEPPEKRLR